MTRTFLDLPRPCGRTTVPRTIWSACLGSTPRRSVTSTVSSNLANFTFCKRGTASVSVYWRFSTAARALSMFFPDLRLIHFSLSPTASQNFCGPWCCRWKQLAIGYRSTEYPDAYCLLLLPGCLRRPKPIWILWQSWQFRRSLPANCHLLVANCYGVTSIPMLRAVPFTLLIAVSSDAAFKSGIFCFAISATCFSVTLPTLSLFGVPDPLAMPAARFNN